MDDKPFPDISVAYKKSSKRTGGIVFLILLLLFTLIAVFVGIRYFTSNNFISGMFQSASPTPTENVEQKTVSPTEPPQTPTPTVTEELDRSDLTVDVQNGSGEKGVAGALSDFITEAGYTVGTVGNAEEFDYVGLTIQIKADKAAYLEQLRSDLAKEYTITAATKDLPKSASADALVIYGKEK